MTESFDFTNFEATRIDVKLPGGDHYVLVELNESGHQRYMSDLMKDIKLDKDKNPIPNANMARTESLLLQLCLRKVVPEAEDEEVPLDLILNLPTRITRQLVAKAREISGLEDEMTEAEITAKMEELEEKLRVLRASGKEGSKLGNS